MRKNKNILIERIKNGIKSPFSDELIALIKSSIRMIPQIYELNDNLMSKFGGLPLMRNDDSWIRDKFDTPYLFLCQIDLEEISEFELEEILPEKGILSFWFSSNDWNDGKVIYYSNKKELIKKKAPIEFRKNEERKKLPFWRKISVKKNNLEIFKECPIKFEKEYHSPSWDSLQMKLYHFNNNTKSRDLEIDENFIDDYLCENKSDHHLFGYYCGLQESIYELYQYTNGHFPKKLDKPLIDKGLKWKLLAQIDSDNLIGMSWIDWGRIYFFITETDLQEGNFKNIKAYLDTT